MQRVRHLMGKHIDNVKLVPKPLQGGVQEDTEDKNGL